MAPNRREEIKKKEELQARFRLSIAQNNARALNWLKPLSPNTNDTTLSITQEPNTTSPTQEDEFMKLRVIPQGSGLSSKTTQTVGDFLNAKDISQRKKTNDGNTPRKTSGGNGSGSFAMHALLNKMRTETRKQISQSHQMGQEQHGKSKKEKKNDTIKSGKADSKLKQEFNSDEDDDDDIKALRSRSVSKTNKGKVGKKARPF
ncbi:hypothetical protein FOB58_003265 [Candida parapsilosis]|uniref:Nucleolar protein 19 n=2 Tax=Candida parapsilosis TaxID=5480 RepID=G8B6I5_CANPC|nr:uncharacterized protein CPAR2_101050 [Candida parapsilosis]KAF6048045.1 hypothetical protein FOB59_003088 [Candida parapsilosis]KAF6049988.1 hypothetical protein FOB58_003265 [Candida parapsilosis]KAF6057851.1 hypothetical protein FOB60_002406 [Candida parapsilosis]KAF6065442.1 hypothetical protein FOB61_001512 [Candida parapsilosis]KAI5903417.1 hypothetical protein K4G60_g2572 [Candida parapsilosis]